MVGQRQLERMRARKLRHRLVLRLGERRAANIVARAGPGIPLGELDAARLVPAGRVPEIEVRPRDVGLPAGRERDGRVKRRQRLGLLVRALVRTNRPGHEIHPVRIDQRHEVERRGIVQRLRLPSVDLPPGRIRLGIGFQIPQQDGRRDPLVAVMRGVVAHLRRPHADADGHDLASQHGTADRLGAQKRIARQQPVDEQRHERVGIPHVKRHEREGARDDQLRPDAQTVGPDAGIGRLDGRYPGPVPGRNAVQRIARAYHVHRIPRQIGEQLRPRQPPHDPVRRQPVVTLEPRQGRLRPSAEQPVDIARVIAGAAQRQLQVFDHGPAAPIAQSFQSVPPPVSSRISPPQLDKICGNWYNIMQRQGG